MAKFMMKPTIGYDHYTTRLGAGEGAANNVDDKEVGKLVKLVGESRYDVCSSGDAIEGCIVAVEAATMDGFTIGTIMTEDRLDVTFDGSEADGTGAIAVGDYVVAGPQEAKGTGLSAPAKVRKAADQAAQVRFAWRVISLGSAQSGAVGTAGVIERIC